jgi:TRAP-type C4-dicarboxylate transport system permease small subunit
LWEWLSATIIAAGKPLPQKFGNDFLRSVRENQEHRMPFLQRISQAVNGVVEKILFVIGAAICIILFGQVVFRYAGASLGWSEEVSRHLLVAITFLGGTVAYKRASFIGLKGFGHKLGPVVQQAIVVGLQVLTLACFSLIAWFGVAYTVKAAEHTSSSLQIPMAVPFSVIPVASVIFVVHVLADIARTLERKAP